MKTLGDAWNWYQATNATLRLMLRLGTKHWADPSLAEASIWRDDRFKMLEAPDLVRQTEHSLAPIDDLAIVVLFSVFESVVRDYVERQIVPERDRLTHPVLVEAAKDAIQGVKEGSFFKRILEPLKLQEAVSADFVTEVDQVRKYRNWVAHGRRGDAVNNVTPREAFDRLGKFLEYLGIAVDTEQDSSQEEILLDSLVEEDEEIREANIENAREEGWHFEPGVGFLDEHGTLKLDDLGREL